MGSNISLEKFQVSKTIERHNSDYLSHNFRNVSGVILSEYLPPYQSANFELLDVSDNPTGNGDALRAAINRGAAASPNGIPKSYSNLYTIIMPPAIYDAGTAPFFFDQNTAGYLRFQSMAPNQAVIKRQEINSSSNTGQSIIHLSGNNISPKALIFDGINFQLPSPQKNIGTTGKFSSVFYSNQTGRYFTSCAFKNCEFAANNLFKSEKQNQNAKTNVINTIFENCSNLSLDHVNVIAEISNNFASTNSDFVECNLKNLTLNAGNCVFDGGVINNSIITCYDNYAIRNYVTVKNSMLVFSEQPSGLFYADMENSNITFSNSVNFEGGSFRNCQIEGLLGGSALYPLRAVNNLFIGMPTGLDFELDFSGSNVVIP